MCARLLCPRPFISSHFPAGADGKSAFKYNLVPAYLRLPGGQDALIVRSVNGSSWSGNGTTSTTRNPDKLTLTTFLAQDGASVGGWARSTTCVSRGELSHVSPAVCAVPRARRPAAELVVAGPSRALSGAQARVIVHRVHIP